MKYVRSASSLLPLACALFLFAAVIAWQPDTTKGKSRKNDFKNNSDTTVPKPADIDQTDFQLNLDSVMQQVNEALSKIDYAKMNADVQKAMAQVDYSKMNLEISKAMKDIDWNKMKLNVSRSLDSAKMAMDKINWDEMKANISHAQAEENKAMAAQNLNTDNLRKQIQNSLQDTQRNLHSAQLNMKKYKDLQAALEKDGLITEGKPYRIQLKEGTLYINGTKQSQTVTDKYRRYYPDEKNFTINNDGGTDL